MASLVLSVIGDDRPGLVSTVARLVEERGGSWQRSQMARLAGKFAGVALVDVPDDDVAALEDQLAALASDGLQVRVDRADRADAAAGGREAVEAAGAGDVSLRLLGQDRPGIVAEISAALAAHQVGIDELATDVRDAPMAGGSLFEVEARLSVPATTDLSAVRAALEQLADELMVDLSLEPTPSA